MVWFFLGCLWHINSCSPSGCVNGAAVFSLSWNLFHLFAFAHEFCFGPLFYSEGVNGKQQLLNDSTCSRDVSVRMSMMFSSSVVLLFSHVLWHSRAKVTPSHHLVLLSTHTHTHTVLVIKWVEVSILEGSKGVEVGGGVCVLKHLKWMFTFLWTVNTFRSH